MNHKIEKFWNWFSKNEKRIWIANENNSHDYLFEIKERLSFVGTDEYGAAVEVYNISDTKKRLEISAEGVLELFDVIIKIVEAAPHYEKWDIIAFRQPMPTPFCLKYNDMRFDTSKMLFFPYEDDNNELNLIIFGDNFNEYNEGDLIRYGFTTIDNLIGEYNCVMKVKGYNFVDKNEIGEKTVFELETLPDFLYEYYSDKS